MMAGRARLTAMPAVFMLTLIAVATTSLAAPAYIPDISADKLNKLLEGIYSRAQKKAEVELSWVDWKGVDNKNLYLGWSTFLWDFFGPFFNCVSKERMGRLGEGGKWVCGVRTFLQKEDCVIYDFGYEGETSFAHEMLELTPCKVYVFDPNLGEDDVKQISRLGPHVKYIPWGLGANDETLPEREGVRQKPWEMKRLPSIMAALNHSWVDVLKVDVEWAEWSVIPDLVNSYEKLPFGQLLLELHAAGPGFTYPAREALKGLQKKGLRAFSADPNLNMYNAKENAHYIEYAFLQVDPQGRIVTGDNEEDRALI